MLSPGREVHPNYLRVLRRSLKEVVLPDVEGSAARNALTFTDFVLTRMIAAMEELPAIRSNQSAGYHAVDTAAATLLGEAGTLPDTPLWAVAEALQHRAGHLFDQAGSADVLADIAAQNAAFMEAQEAAAAYVADRAEAPRPAFAKVTAEAAQTYFDRRFPDAGLRVSSCDELAGGRSKSTLMLRIDPHPDWPADMVLRIDRPGSAQATTVRDEYPVMDILYRAGVNAPEPLLLESDPAALGAPFLIMRRMPGTVPGDYWSAGSATPALGRALAETLAQLHRPAATDVWPDAPSMAADAVAAMVAASEVEWRSHNIPSLTLECAFGWMRRHMDCITGPAVPIHGDTHFGNVLSEDDRITCLTDWEFVHPGHPAEDIAFARVYIESIMPWMDFVTTYEAAGRAAVTDEQMRFFQIWSYVRNVTSSASLLHRFLAGSIEDVLSLGIALNSRARLENALAQLVTRELARDAGRRVEGS